MAILLLNCAYVKPARRPANLGENAKSKKENQKNSPSKLRVTFLAFPVVFAMLREISKINFIKKACHKLHMVCGGEDVPFKAFFNRR